ncbi:MAG: RluA family pseudouridine synthase [Christensenellaceae bacterium]|jgi:23S rRNA-/tRNA-specific pseudouridylate synthase|nr:RluA family pseudouridine synthase [Christensenellaceae bacterium]
MKVIYDDDNVIVVHKPQGIETATFGGVSPRTSSALPADYPLVKHAPTPPATLESQVAAFAVHRLDVNTEGLVIFAKTQIAKSELELAFKNHTVEKTYWALCFGTLRTSPLELGGYLLKDAKTGVVKVFKDRVGGAVPIKTIVRQIKAVDDMILLEIKPLTGRTHQIRAHLASIGISIAGDGKYGDFKLNKAHGLKKQCLCAVGLRFNFPPSSPLAYLNAKTFNTKPLTFGY